MPTSGGGHKSEPELGQLSNILKTFNDQFGNIPWTDADRDYVADCNLLSAAAQERLCDTQYEDCRAPLLDLIRTENVGIDVAFWFMEDSRFVAELIRAKDRGAIVRVLVDQRANNSKRLNETILNAMRDGGHVRLMVTRGVRSTPYQDPRVVVTPATIVIIAEYKEPDPAVYERGLKLFTVHVRRGDPAVQDQKINSHSKLNCILASVQAIQAGADEALMLDPHGFVATCNSTHFFIVRKGEIWTSSGKYCLGGITREIALEIAREAGIPAVEKDFSLTDVYGADEAFVTGTFAGIVPVREVDGRALNCRGPMVERLQRLYADRVERDAEEQERP